MSITNARAMTPEEEAEYRNVERAEEAKLAASRRGREVKSLSWSNDNSRMARITDSDGNDFLRLQFTEAHEDDRGRTVFRQVECVIPCMFRVIA